MPKLTPTTPRTRRPVHPNSSSNFFPPLLLASIPSVRRSGSSVVSKSPTRLNFCEAGNMQKPSIAETHLANADHCSSNDFATSSVMPYNSGHILRNGDAGLEKARVSESLIRHQAQNDSGAGERSDPEIMELYHRSCMQEKEILFLRTQIRDACTKELQLLNEKHILERRLTELQIALDEKQDDAVASAFKELTKKQSYLEENLKLSTDLKFVEEETYIFTSALLSLLAKYDIRPHQISSSAIYLGLKQLYQNMDWQIRSYANMNSMAHLIGNRPDNFTADRNLQHPSSSRYQLSHTYGGSMIPELHVYNQYPKDLPGKVEMDVKGINIALNPEMHYRPVDEKSRHPLSDIYKETGDSDAPNSSQAYVYEASSRIPNVDTQNPMATMSDDQGSFVSEGKYNLPSIEGFQVCGDAKPGSILQASGYPINGTTLCIFQWVRELDNGTRQYIEGATIPEYVVTADDVGTFLAVECTPIDDRGYQGDLVTQFVNSQSKITCDPEMQDQINTYISAGKATFNVKVLEGSSNWEQAILSMKQSTYQIIIKPSDRVVIEEKYSPELKVKVPLGYTTQFVLTCLNGVNLPLTTGGTSQPNSLENDVRLRDVIVLTMRYFQSKLLDTKRKVKA